MINNHLREERRGERKRGGKREERGEREKRAERKEREREEGGEYNYVRIQMVWLLYSPVVFTAIVSL